MQKKDVVIVLSIVIGVLVSAFAVQCVRMIEASFNDQIHGQAIIERIYSDKIADDSLQRDCVIVGGKFVEAKKDPNLKIDITDAECLTNESSTSTK